MAYNNNYSDKIMHRQASILLEMKEGLGINGYIGNDDEYADFRDNLTKMLRENNCIRPSYKVSSMWFTDGKLCSFDKQNISNVYFNISLLDCNYNELTITSGNYRVLSKNCYRASEEVLSLILDECDKLVKHLKNMIVDANISPNISDLMETLLSCAQKYINKEIYNVGIEEGKLNKENDDTEPYKCLVVRYKDGDYHSSMTFSKNKIGKYFATQRTPLCGESTISFTLDTLEEQMKKIINF